MEERDERGGINMGGERKGKRGESAKEKKTQREMRMGKNGQKIRVKRETRGRMRLQCAIIRVSDFAREGIQSTVKCT